MIKSASIAFDPDKIRQSFPILQTSVHGQPLVYLDNAATTQKPAEVINAIIQYYKYYNSNVHRGIHYLSQLATEAYEDARKKVADFINAQHTHEIIFTKGATNSINLVAHTFGKKYLHEGDEIIISAMEHHSNIVPWQLICEERKASLKVIAINKTGELLLDDFEKLLTSRVKLIAITYVSNTLGTINPIEYIIEKAHALKIPVFIDAAQAIQHIAIDVQMQDIDFMAFSGHKMYGPTGIGVLYGKEKYLNELPPFESGGDMIKTVSFTKTTFNDLPYKFEAGTPDICGAIGLGAAIDFICTTGIDNIHHWEKEVIAYAIEKLSAIDGLQFIGNAAHRAGSISFLVYDIHPSDMGELLDKQGIAVRTGHHCTQPLMEIYGIPGTTRASFALYNTMEDVNRLAEGIKKTIRTMNYEL